MLTFISVPVRARLALLYVATFWGASWFAFRQLYATGMSAMAVGVAISAVASVLTGYWARAHVWQQFRASPVWVWLLILICAALSNLGFTWGMVHGEVMRVMLLFYLMPIWTGLLAHFVLRERANWAGWTGVALGILGMAIMLYRPEMGIPMPRTTAEWAGLSAGLATAILNTVVRYAPQNSLSQTPRTLDPQARAMTRSFAFGLGAFIFGLAWLPFESGAHLPRTESIPIAAVWIVGMGGLLAVSYRMYQYGLTHLTAHQAVVIFPFELVVGAVTSALWAGEMMSTRAWVGGLFIALASFIANWWGQHEDEAHPG